MDTFEWEKFGDVVPVRPKKKVLEGEGLGEEKVEEQHAEEENEEEGELTWGDVVLALAAEIVGECRLAVQTRLGYTCSAGLAHNKVRSLRKHSKIPTWLIFSLYATHRFSQRFVRGT